MIRFYIQILIISFAFTGCSGCSKSGLKSRQAKNALPKTQTIEKVKNNPQTTVKMRKANGVYYIPALINGVEMEFIFDTGASDILISDVEAMFLLKQGKIDESHILGSQYYYIADGSIAEGTALILTSVKIGNKTLYNVKASIIHNSEAPLLLGQSALEKFGKVTIDYTRNEIILE